MRRQEHATADELDVLIFGEESNQNVDDISHHVENCEVCLQRMETLSAPSEFDTEVDQFLKESEFDTPAEEIMIPGIRPPSHPELLGRIGRYDIESIIGHGGMGSVVKAHDAELNRPVAIKLLKGHLVCNGSAKKRFVREAKAVAAVVNEHVVAIYNVEQDEKTPFLVMQYVAGESLQSRVDRDGPLDPLEILRIGAQVAAGLAAAHRQGIVHRDIKPANILLEQGVERALVTDFGLAQSMDDASLTQSGFLTGTPHYMSPEQATGQRADHRSDLFSLGSVMYFMATGHPPFRADNSMGVLHKICREKQSSIWKANPQIPPQLCDVINRLLQKKNTRRFQNAPALEERLLKILGDLQSRKNVVRNRLANACRRFAVPLIGVLSSVAFVVAFLAFQHSKTPSQDDSKDSNNTRQETTSPESDGGASFSTASFIGESEEADWNREIESIDKQIDELSKFDDSLPD